VKTIPDRIKEMAEIFISNSKQRSGPLFLNWKDWGSFLSKGVQEVLMERHPSRHHYPTTGGIGYPVYAWKIVDQFATPAPPLSSEFDDLLRYDPSWIARLLAAISDYRTQHDEQMRNPKTPLHDLERWRTDYYLEETTTDYLNEEVEIPRDIKMELPSPKAHMEGRAKCFSDPGSTYRVAFHDENRRREKIMRLWGECCVTAIKADETSEFTLPPSAVDMARSILRDSGFPNAKSFPLAVSETPLKV
jgi:hypothetical protein